MAKTRDGFFSGLKDAESAKNVSSGGHISDAIRSEDGSYKKDESGKSWFGSKGDVLRKGGEGTNNSYYYYMYLYMYDNN